VIGGMTMSGLWERVAAAFTSESRIPVEVVVTGPKRQLDAYCRAHPVDLVTMHTGDTVADLAADGLFERLTPWARNAQMLVGHRSDPAGVAEAQRLENALQKLSASQAPFLVHASGGTFEVFTALRARYDWLPRTLRFTPAKRGFLQETAAVKGYTLYGTIPFLLQKQSDPQIRGYFFDDPVLRRPYLAAVGAETRIGRTQHERAAALLTFLTSPRAQALLESFRLEGFPDYPVFFPVTPARR